MKKKTNVILKKWKKNNREEYRVMLQEFRGQTVLSLRSWYLADGGEFKSGHAGINVYAPHWESLFQGIRRARKRLRKRGLLKGKTDRASGPH